MDLELGIKRRLSYLFVALAVALIGALVYSNAEVQSARQLALAWSTHNVFERILSEALRTNDVPELSRLLKRSASPDRTFFVTDDNAGQLILPNYARRDEFQALVATGGRCRGRLTSVKFGGRDAKLYCGDLAAEGSDHHFVFYQVMPAESPAPAGFIWISLTIAVVILIILWLVLSKIMNDQLFRPMEELERHIGTQLATDGAPPFAPAQGGPAEIRRLRQTFDELLARAKATFTLEKKVLASETKERIARQVAHDIRSPLSALNMVFARFDQAGEDGRLLGRKAIGRINDIANDLLRGSQVERTSEALNPAPVLIESEVDGVVSETRAVFANRPGLEIIFEQRLYPRDFVSVRPGELRRALANLIINSVEALPNEGGTVNVAVESGPAEVRVLVRDDGRGIAPEHLPMVGTPGYSVGKTGESGSGLGVSYARDLARRAGGTLGITSDLGRGTVVTMSFPKASRPDWYLDCLRVKPGTTVVVLDDDPSVQQMWANVFAKRTDLRVALVGLTRGHDLRALDGDVLYLIDYELAVDEPSGLDLIERFGLADRSVLVTSRFDDAAIIARCERLGVPQIPKVAAGLVPVVARA